MNHVIEYKTACVVTLVAMLLPTFSVHGQTDARNNSRVATTKTSWPAVIEAPKGFEKRPGPWSDGATPTIWPNRISRANSDPWIAKNHDQIKEMRPRLLLINYSNEHSPEQLTALANRLIECLSESSRYHGYRNADAPAFLKYHIFHLVDLRDRDRTTGDSRSVSIKDLNAKTGFNFAYAKLFSDDFAQLMQIPDPREPQRFLRLDELIDGGFIHEVWFFGSGRVPEQPHIGAFEVVEHKPKYNELFQRLGNHYVQAGNGGDEEQPWIGRSVRIGFVNASRGPGCFLESLAHGLEGNANSGAIPYYTKYFHEFAGMDWDKRYGLPFNSLYGANLGNEKVVYKRNGQMIIPHAGNKLTVDNFVANGGNAHFPPNGRSHYDLNNTEPVRSTIEDWRIGNGKNKSDQAEDWTNAKFEKYRNLAPDCMGPWLIYWRQNMPGLDNQQKDDRGKPMKNWWPFLFY